MQNRDIFPQIILSANLSASIYNNVHTIDPSHKYNKYSMSKANKLDKTDVKILQTLQKEARITNQELAERVALSPSSCLQRVRRLETQGFIDSYHAKINLSAFCRHIMCIATVSMKNHTQEDFRAFETLVEQIPEVVECFTVSGEFDFFLRIICPDMRRYLEINERLVSSANYLMSINTHVVMNENKQFYGADLESLRESEA